MLQNHNTRICRQVGYFLMTFAKANKEYQTHDKDLARTDENALLEYFHYICYYRID